MAVKSMMEPAAPKPTSQSMTVWAAFALVFLEFLPQVQEILLTYYPGFMEGHGNLGFALLLLMLRFKSKGPLSGIGGAIGLGINYTTDKAVGGLKKGLNILPGVSLK